MKHIVKYCRPYFKMMGLGLIIKFTGTIMDLALPWILSYMIDNVVPMKNKQLIYMWGAVMICCAIISVAGNIIANRMASRSARNVTENLRHDLFSKIMSLSAHEIDEFTLPSLELRLTSDTYNVHRMVTMIQRLGIRAPILLIGGIAVTITLDPILALVLIAVMPFIAITIYLISKKGIPMFTILQQKTDRMVQVVRENISGIRIIKALSKSDYEKNRFRIANADVANTETKANQVMSLSNPLMNLFLNIGLVMVILAGAYRVSSGHTQTGTIIAFLSYFTIILNAMMAITRMFMMTSKGLASADRIGQVLDCKEEMEVIEMETVEEEAHVVFDHVTFSYHNLEANINDIDFKLNHGETLGIIGATGSGKSTIISLLLRLYDTQVGQIRISGKPIQSIPFEKLHQMFGIVFQNDFLIAESVQENIDFGRNLTMSQIEKAAKDAQAYDFIDHLEERFDYRLAPRGMNLSGGQKQRVLIARALATSPEILILDDSSSALDYKTDANLRQSLQTDYDKITTIIIAQRVSSIHQADHILVLDEGKMIGYGTHEELLKNCENYREISESQMGGDFDAA